MPSSINLTKGLYFKNELELERAILLLKESGFELHQNMETYYDVEIALSVENRRLAQNYRPSIAVSF